MDSHEDLREKHKDKYQKIRNEEKEEKEKEKEKKKKKKGTNIPKKIVNFLRKYFEKGEYKERAGDWNNLMRVFKEAGEYGNTRHLGKMFGS